MVAVSVLTCEKFTNVRDITCACDHNELSPICVDVLITRLTVRLMFTVRFLYPRISFLPLSAINTHFHYAEINSGSKKTHTKEQQTPFLFFFWFSLDI